MGEISSPEKNNRHDENLDENQSQLAKTIALSEKSSQTSVHTSGNNGILLSILFKLMVCLIQLMKRIKKTSNHHNFLVWTMDMTVDTAG
jgi:hypothetical protein